VEDRSQVVGPGCVQGLQVVAWSWCWQSCRFADNVGGWRRSQCAVTFGALADCPAAPCAHVKCHYAPNAPNAPNDTIPRLDSVAFSMRARAAAPGHHQARRLGQKPMTRLSPLLHGQQGDDAELEFDKTCPYTCRVPVSATRDCWMRCVGVGFDCFE